MKARAFSFVKEQIAASEPAASDAAGAAQCAEVYQFTRKEGGQDMDAAAAHRVVAQVSLGKKSLIYRHGNDISERAGAIKELSQMLKTALYRDGEKRVPFDTRIRNCIAATALDELTFDRCGSCLGRGEIQDHSVEALEGPQPMRVCDRCLGAKRLRFNEDQRVENLAREWISAFPKQNIDDPEAVRLVANSLRKDAMFKKLSSCVDYAKGLILECERIAVEQAGLMLERWKLGDVG